MDSRRLGEVPLRLTGLPTPVNSVLTPSLLHSTNGGKLLPYDKIMTLPRDCDLGTVSQPGIVLPMRYRVPRELGPAPVGTVYAHGKRQSRVLKRQACV